MSNKPVSVPVSADAASIGRWCSELRTGSVAQRRAAADALAEVRPMPAAVVAAFIRALADRDQAVVARASEALQRLGRDGCQPLLAALGEPGTDVAILKGVARILAAVWPQSAAHRLMKDLVCGDAPAQNAAAAGLGDLGPEARDAVPVLAWTMRHGSDAKIREAAGLALGQIGPHLPEVVATLAKALEGEPVSPDARRGADPKAYAAILARIGTPRALAVLVRVLRDHPAAPARRAAAEALGEVVPAARSSVGPLVDALADACPTVREAATRALVAMGDAAGDKLAAALRDGEPEARQRAAVALGRMAQASRGVVAALVQAMSDTDVRVGLLAAVAVLKLSAATEAAQPTAGDDPDVERALAVLVRVVKRKAGGSRTRQEAAEALGRVGPVARVAVRPLLGIVSDATEDRLVRQSAWWAVQRIAPEETAGLKCP